MSAMIHLVEPFAYQAGLQEGATITDELVMFDLPLEQQLNQALARVTQLEQENQHLRTELLQTDRELKQRILLLRNARIRERSLRAQLASNAF